MVYDSVLEMIGNTPIINLKKLKEELNLKANIYAKVEAKNPGGSVKDRAAYQMILDYEKKGIINKNTILIEPTSGNTGIGLALVCAVLGYKFIVCMPDTMSIERRKLIAAYGATIVLTEGKLGMPGAIAKANELKETYGDAIIIGQFENPSNPLVHYLYTAKEIDKELAGKIDLLVAGIGTGGTISGISQYFKEKNTKFKAIGVEPFESPYINKHQAGPHKIQGIGAGFIPENLNLEKVDEVMMIKSDEAIKTARMLPRIEGLLIGISSGAALAAAIKLAQRSENEDKNIVVILPDSAERYLSTDLFKE